MPNQYTTWKKTKDLSDTDKQHLITFVKENMEKEIDENFVKKMTLVIMAMKKQKIVGVVFLRKQDAHLRHVMFEVNALCVMKDKRGQGIGGNILNTAKEIVPERSFLQLYVDNNDNHDSLFYWYKFHGFHVVYRTCAETCMKTSVKKKTHKMTGLAICMIMILMGCAMLIEFKK